MRASRAALTIAITLLITLLAAPANARTLIRLHADRVEFYFDRFLLEADGGVHVTTSDGLTIDGDAFSMDLKLNRFLIAGHVHVTGPTGALSAAAFSDYVDFDREYVVPVTTAPDRWTYLGTDFAHPLKGREMPGDVFFFPDTGGVRPNIVAHNATISTKSFVKFSGPIVDTFGFKLPLPTFYLNFSSNPNLGINSLTGATVDVTWNFAGSDNAISALHARYDTINKAYLSFEQHVAWNQGYAVFSVNPFTTKAKWWNLVASEQPNSRFQIQTFSQLYTYQSGLTLPTASAQSTFVTATQALPQSYLVATGNFTDYNMLGPGQGTGSLNHPTSLELSWVSSPHKIKHLPLTFQVRLGYGFNHDSVGSQVPGGLQEYGGTVYSTIWNHLVGFNVSTPGIKLGDHYDPNKTYYFNASLDKQREWFTVPHYQDVTAVGGSLSRTFSRKFSSYFAYTNTNVADLYIHGGYSPYVPSTPNSPFSSFSSFRGTATYRAYTLGLNYIPDPDLLFIVTAQQRRDFPIAVPGLFPLPPLNVLGQYTYTPFLGMPPYNITGEVRARFAPHIVVDLQRTYYFNFGNLRWSPNFILQVTQ